jgi:tRNA-splicing ligase RtcB
MGTLGGGNHFIELCVEQGGADDGRVWLMLHSGSRNIGKELAERHMATARKLPHNQDLPDRDLAVFLTGTPEMSAYRHDLFWAQEYAARNRSTMLQLCLRALSAPLDGLPLAWGEPISCHHNYVAEEVHDGREVLVTRKGAIKAGKGELGIIPGSMGTGSYVVAGLGNEAAMCSASHGAGRRMSRRQAKRTFTEADLAEQTASVECRKDSGVLDEIPGAYKDIADVMARQADLVEVVHHLKQVVCVKG